MIAPFVDEKRIEFRLLVAIEKVATAGLVGVAEWLEDGPTSLEEEMARGGSNLSEEGGS